MKEVSPDKKTLIRREDTFDSTMEKEKIVFTGSHPDSLYRVSANSGAASSNMVRVMRALRWPMALLLVCTALAVFVYFLMPDNLDSDAELANSTIWQARPISAGESLFHKGEKARKVISSDHPLSDLSGKKKPKPVEIDFYDSENGTNVELISITQDTTEVRPNRNLPAAPVFPEHLTPEVQYGNEKADTDKTRSPKILNEQNNLPEDSTLKPQITQKPEKPLAIYFKDVIGGLKPEIITRAETVNDFDVYEKVTAEEPKEHPTRYRVKEEPGRYIPPEVQEYYGRPSYPDGNFTSGHSKFFGIGIEDVETMKSTTQSSVYNTRVSPTLPTWRDGDDSTTKNYPLNLNTDVRNCRTPNLPLCRGVLPYDLAGPPPTLAGVEITSLLPQMEYLVSTNCSERTRLFVCSLMEPECNPPPFPAKTPCYNLCKAVTDNCETHIPAALAPVFNCKRYEKVNCMNARAPCYMREMACDDGTCVPREWICDGKDDCSSGEDEKKCRSCDKNQFRCSAGTCIMQRWVCDGYLDCPDGDDESQKTCGKANAEARITEEEPGEEPAGSAPAPSVRRPNKIQERKRKPERIGDNDSSKELLMTSDSNNALKRNFTRRPSSSRLTPYNKPSLPKRPKQETFVEEESEETTTKSVRKITTKTTVQPSTDTQQGSSEDINIADLRFFEDIEKLSKDENLKSGNLVPKPEPLYVPKNTMSPQAAKLALSQLNKDTNKFSRVIDSGALLRTAAEELEREKAKLRNMTEPEEYERPKSSHTSPCPSGELRCVDGRCITLAQLCDGTIDCTDHADEDNCYT